MTTVAKSVMYYGSEKPVPRPVALKAGPLTMIFEPETAFLRHVRLGDFEVVRAIYAAIRDENWATVLPQLSNLQTQVEKDSFKLSFYVRCQKGHIDYFWRGTITGGSDREVSYAFDGETTSDFQRNRIGVCVLQPVKEWAGKPLTIEDDDGAVEQGVFPKEIAAYEPFKEVR